MTKKQKFNILEFYFVCHGFSDVLSIYSTKVVLRNQNNKAEKARCLSLLSRDNCLNEDKPNYKINSRFAHRLHDTLKTATTFHGFS